MPAVDRAPQVAEYLLEAEDLGTDAEVLDQLCRRWPGLTVQEALRGSEIALELSAATVCELQAQIADCTWAPTE